MGSMPVSMAQVEGENDENGMSELLVYDNSNLGFTLEYPSDWIKEESLSFVSPRLSVSDEAPESIAVTTEPNISNLTLQEYSDSSLSILESQFPNFTLIESSNSTLSGYPSYQILYTYTFEDVDLKNLQIWTIADDMVYVLTYGGTTKEFDNSFPVIQNMVDSFEITEIQ
jgi:serine/threonine-protein kinase